MSAFGGKAVIEWRCEECPLLTQSGRGPPIDLAQGTASKSNLWLFVGLADVISISPTPAALAERSSLRLGSLYSW